MADQDNGNGAGEAQQPQAAQEGAPQLQILGQFIRDLSFEAPEGPLALQGQAPTMRVNVDVRANKHAEDQYISELHLSAKAENDGKTVFLAELQYAGLFGLKNIPEQSMQPVLLIECPRLLFPFARRIIADVTRDGGFPPLMLEPIDFAALLRQQMANQQAAAGQDASS